MHDLCPTCTADGYDGAPRIALANGFHRCERGHEYKEGRPRAPENDGDVAGETWVASAGRVLMTKFSPAREPTPLEKALTVGRFAPPPGMITGCFGVSKDELRARLAAASPDLLRVIVSRLEWVDSDGLEPHCVPCGAVKSRGHRDDCELAAALTKARGASR